jgi:type II secretory pathway component PulF
MPNFRYRALTHGGEVVIGEVEAPSCDEVLRRIEYLGHLPIDTQVVASDALVRESCPGPAMSPFSCANWLFSSAPG